MPDDRITATIESRDDYPKTKAGKAQYWQDELHGAQRTLKSWHRQGDRIHLRYLDERTDDQSTATRGLRKGFRLNLFYANVQTILGLLYGRLPKIDVSRRYDDAEDDTGRVAAMLMERLLNNDMADSPTAYDSLLRATLEDRLVPGLGVAKVRYEVDSKQVLVPDEYDDENGAPKVRTEITAERAPTDYFHWRDVLWSWSRTASDLRWVAFRSHITKEEATTRYSADVAEKLSYKSHKMVTDDADQSTVATPEDDDYWLKAEIWEIWDKETRKVIEFSFVCDILLKTSPDPLELANFFPCPPFLIANATTSLYKPTPDFHFAQQLYNEIDKLQARIAVITEAVKVVGLYNAKNPEVARMFKEGTDNKLIPVVDWAMFAEQGGLNGAIDWFPIADVVAALLQLRQLRDETIQLLYQVTGMADVMRGQLDNQYEGVGQTNEKIKFGSARLQKLQGEFATFVTNLMALKAEVIAKHFDPETIIDQSNAAELSEKPETIAKAVSLIRNYKESRLRVKITSESMALVDYAQMQQERGAFLEGMAGFMQAAAPLVEQEPTTAPYLLKLLQWGLAGFRGADEAEGILDQAIEAAAEAAKNPQPDPAAAAQQAQLAVEQAKSQAQQELERMKHEHTMQQGQAKSQQELTLRHADMQADIQTSQAQHDMKMREIEAAFIAETQGVELKAQADIAVEQMTSQTNVEQHDASVAAEIDKEIVTHDLDMEAERAKAALDIRTTAFDAETKAATNDSD